WVSLKIADAPFPFNVGAAYGSRSSCGRPSLLRWPCSASWIALDAAPLIRSIAVDRCFRAATSRGIENRDCDLERSHGKTSLQVSSPAQASIRIGVVSLFQLPTR